MSPRFRSLFALAFAAASAACSATPKVSVAPARALVACPGGSIGTPEQAAAFAGCEVVAGDLTIQGSGVRELGTLSELVHVSGALVIAENPNLETLSGLERLSAVGSLQVRDNASLESLSALESLSLASSVTIANNPDLRSLSGLEGLEKLDRLEIRSSGLRDTHGVEGLRSVGELVIAKNRSLISLGGFGNVTHAGSIRINDNPRLCAQLGMFPRLQAVHGDLSITRNWGVSEGDLDDLRARTGRSAMVARGEGEVALATAER